MIDKFFQIIIQRLEEIIFVVCYFIVVCGKTIVFLWDKININ